VEPISGSNVIPRRARSGLASSKASSLLFSRMIKSSSSYSSSTCSTLRDWCFIAEQPAPAPHFAHLEGCAALRIVRVTVVRQIFVKSFPRCRVVRLRPGTSGIATLYLLVLERVVLPDDRMQPIAGQQRRLGCAAWDSGGSGFGPTSGRKISLFRLSLYPSLCVPPHPPNL